MTVYSGTDRAFLWRDYDNLAALDNVTVQGFLAVIDEAFGVDSPTYDSLDRRLENINILTFKKLC